MTRRIHALRFAFACLATSGLVSGQAIQFRFQQGSLITAATDGSTVTMAADGIGKVTQAALAATYTGTTGAVITDIRLVAPADFSLTNMPPLPQGLTSGQSVGLNVKYLPSASTRTFAQIAVTYVEGPATKIVTLTLAGTAPEFTVGYILPTDYNFNFLSLGGSLPFPPTGIGSTSAVTIVVTNRGSGGGSVNSVSLAGSGFQLVNLPALPWPAGPANEIRFGIVFSPQPTGAQSSTLSIVFPDRTFSAQLVGTTAPSDIRVSYYLQTDGNVTSLNSGGKLVFPATKVNANANAVVAIANYGTGSGYVNSITLTGQNFQLTGMSTLPLLLGAGKQIQFGISYSPDNIAPSTGSLQIVLADRTITVDVSGAASGAVFSYSVVNNGTINAVSSRDTLVMPDTALADTSSVVIQIKNAGNADGIIGGIVVTGQGFQLSNLPIMPYYLPANSTVLFNLLFIPTSSGAAKGRLQIGGDAFDLIGNGKGPSLVYTYTTSAGFVPMLASRVIPWGSVQIGQKAQAVLVVRNSGTSSASISTVAIAEGKSAFSLANLFAAPANLSPGAELSIALVFSPLVGGDNTAHLRVESETFTLLGSGTAPVGLPAVTIRAPALTLAPLQQPALGLTLASPYGLPLTGTLTLAVNSNSFSVDPSVQFATGGRIVSFTIPANQTQAQFPTGTDIRIQTGSVAGTINVTAALFTAGGLDLTQDSHPTIDLQVPAAPPQVLDVQLNSQSANGFVVMVTGLSTTRSLTELDLQFSSTSTFKFPSGNFTFNINSSSATWYRSTESQLYGSLFSVAVPIAVQGLGTTVKLSDVVQSVSATLSNEVGRSANLTVMPNP